MSRIDLSPSPHDPWGPASPLAPFLASLDNTPMRPTLRDHQRIQRLLASPAEWSVPQLRSSLCALMARDEDQKHLFLRRFDQFFARRDGVGTIDAGTIDAEQIAQVREELGHLAERSLPPPPDTRGGTPPELTGAPARPISSPPPPQPPARRWVVAVTLVLAGVLVLWMALSANRQGDGELDETSSAEEESSQDTTQIDEVAGPQGEDSRRRRDPAPRLVEVGRKWVPEIQALPRTASVFATALTTTLIYLAWILRRRPSQQAPTWDPAGPRFFDSGAIGPPREPWLDRDTLDRLADSLGFFAADQASRRLDLDRSVRATARHGGEPHLMFEPKRRVHRVLILHDLQTEALGWNPIPGELARGLERRGVPVIEGWFSGAPTSFRTADGGTLHLDDLEDQRQHHLVLLFGDALGFDAQRHRLLLESLARWPMLAWFEPREPGLWRPAMSRLAETGIRCYPATAEALRGAFERLISERGSVRERLLPSRIGWLEGRSRAPLPQRVERLLGDALPWAEASALLEPPVGLGLVDALRRFLAPALPPGRLGRLLALPGSELRNHSLHLAPEVRRVLRHGFEERNSPTQRDSVVAFLLDQVRHAEPEDPHSLQHLAWAWRHERLRFESEPEAALENLVGLRRGPHGARVRDSLLGPGGSASPAESIRPRLTTARSRALWHQLDSDRESGVPLSLSQFALLVALLILTGISLGQFGDDLIQARRLGGASDVVVENATGQTVLVGGRLPGATAEHLTPLAPGETWDWVVDDLSEQVVEVHGLFHKDSWRVSAEVADTINLRAEADTRLTPCFEELGPDLWVERCPPLAEGESADGIVTVQREINALERAAGIHSAVALEITDADLNSTLSQTSELWDRGAIDAVFQLRAQSFETLEGGFNSTRRTRPTDFRLTLPADLEAFEFELLQRPTTTVVYWWSVLRPQSALSNLLQKGALRSRENIIYTGPIGPLGGGLALDGLGSVMGMQNAASDDLVPEPGTFNGLDSAGLPRDTGPATEISPAEVDSETPQQAAPVLVSQQTGRLVDSEFELSSTLDLEASQGLGSVVDALVPQLPPTRAPLADFFPRDESLTLEVRLQEPETVSLAVQGGTEALFFKDRQLLGPGRALANLFKGSGPWTYLALHHEQGVLDSGTCEPGLGLGKIRCATLSGEVTVYRQRVPVFDPPTTNRLGQVRLILDNEERLSFCPPGSQVELSHFISRPWLTQPTEERAIFIDVPETPSPWTYRLIQRAPSGQICDIQEQVVTPPEDAIRIIVSSDSPLEEATRDVLENTFLKIPNSLSIDLDPVDQSTDSPVRDTFSERVLGQSTRSVESYWVRIAGSERSTPPPEVATDEAVIQYLLTNPGSIGYIATSTPLPEGIKTLRVIDEEP